LFTTGTINVGFEFNHHAKYNPVRTSYVLETELLNLEQSVRTVFPSRPIKMHELSIVQFSNGYTLE